MKKITLFLALFTILLSWQANAQITTYPYVEDFEAGDGGWVADNTTAGTWALGAPAGAVINSAASGANAWATNLTGTYNSSEASTVTSPEFDFSALAAPSIEFSIWWNSENGWDGTVIQSSIDNGASWQNIGAVGDPNNWFNNVDIDGSPGGQLEGWSGEVANNGSQGWVVARHALVGLAGESSVFIRVAFGSDTTVTSDGVAFDLVNIFEVTCPEPNGLVVDSATATTANISWTPGGGETDWEVAVQTAGTGQPAGSGDSTDSNAPYVAMTLNPATAYEVYVRSDCGGEFSPWIGPVNFLTECVTFTAPYSEGFENAGAIPICWSMSGGEDWNFDNDPAFEHIGNNGTITGTTATNDFFAWVDASGNDGPTTLTTPLVDVSGLTTPALSFYEISDNEGNANSTLDVEVWDGAAWNNVGTYNTNTVGWELKIIDLSPLTITGDIQARFIFSETVTGDFYDDIAIDDVTFDEAPSCFAPTFLMANNFTSTGADLSWSQDGAVTLWNVEIVTAGTPATGTPTASGVSNPYTESGLLPATDYEYYVQADCGGNLSGWTGPFAFTTECVTFVAPYTQGFENAGVIPICWSMNGGEDWNFDNDPGFNHIGDNGTITGSTATNDYFAWVDASGDDGPTTLVSPFVDVSGLTNPALSFYEISDNEGDANATLDVEVWDGAAWNNVGTYNTNTAGWELKIIDLSPLTITGDVQARFIFSETVTGDFTDDIAIDDVTFDEAPTCFPPTMLVSTGVSSTTADVTWTPVGSAATWNIEVVVAGTPPTGVPTETGVSNPHTITGLTADTDYEFYVQGDCGTDGLSIWTGPSSFYTGYCISEPTSNDGNGVASVTVVATDFTSFGDVMYEDHTATPVSVFPGIQTNLSITFETGFTYWTNIWIDFNDNLIFDASELVYQGESLGDNPTTLDASFLMPVTATPGLHRMRIGTADGGQQTPNPCYNGAFGVTLDFTVDVGILNCTLATVTYTQVDDCDNNQVFVDVNITDLGDATTLEITNDSDATSLQVTTPGTYQAGPFPTLQDVRVFVASLQDSDCTLTSPIFNLVCPPINDDPCDAVVAVVNDDFICAQRTRGSLALAGDSGVAAPSCGGNADDDVWFQFIATSEFQLIALANLTGSNTFNIDHAVYEGTCNALVEIACTDELSSITPQLVIGNTYFIRVYSGGGNPEDTIFDLCITPYEAPQNVDCDLAINYCSGGTDSDILYTPNTVNVDDDRDVACLGTIPNPTYNLVNIGSSGEILITIVQNTAFDENDMPIGDDLDVDYVLWGPFDPALADNDPNHYCNLDLLVDCPTCPNNTTNQAFYPFGNIVDCSYSGAATESITLQNAVEGELYLLLVTNYTFDPIANTNPGIIQVTQTNLGDQSAGTVTGEIAVELGSDLDLCGFTTYDLNAASPFADRYEWYLNDVLIPGEETDTYTAEATGLGSGTYKVIAFDSTCDAQAEDEILVTFGDEVAIDPIDQIVTCDDISADEVENFDLVGHIANFSFLNGQDASMFNITFHESQGDAAQNINPITSPYNNTSNPQTIYVRFTDADAAFCSSIRNFELFISGPQPTAISVDIEECDDDADGITDFDLAAHDANVLGTQDPSIFAVTYHTSEADAEANVNAIDTSTLYSSSSQTIWTRVENSTAFDCYSVIDFDLIVNPLPIASFDVNFDYEVCPNATVPIIITAIADNFSLDNVTIAWYRDSSLIAGENGLTLPVLEEGTYEIEVTYNDTGCTDIAGIRPVVELESCVIPQGISPNNDGQNDTFDLSSYDVQKLEIFNRNGILVYEKTNYTNEWHGQTNDGEELPVGTYFYTMEYEKGKRKSAWVYIQRLN